MKWSFRIATVAGTEVRIHITFLILLLFVGLQGMSGGQGAAAGLDAVLFICALFFCVLLHEFGHVFAARGYGIRTPDVTLLPIGGVARLEKMPRKPAHELVVAIAGPLVNVIIAAAIYLALGFWPAAEAGYAFEKSGHFWEKLMMWNVLMVAFNLVPAFPMDGGRVLRALLAMVVDYGRATRWAAHIGQGLALFTVLYMLISGKGINPMLILIAFFIFMAAGQEAAAVTQEEATKGLRVRDAMLTEFHRLPANASLKDAVNLLLAGTQQDFPVLHEDGGISGILTRNKLIGALAEHGPSHLATNIADPCPDSADPAMSLNEAMERLQHGPCPALPVMNAMGQLVGLLTAENVGETLMVRAALRSAKAKT